MTDPDYRPLDVEGIRSQISGCLIGSDLRYFPEVGSTNRAARELGDGDWSTGTVIITDYQEEGRGRQGRTWIAPPGSSLLFSLLLQAPRRASYIADAVMMAALAVTEAIADTTSLQPELKWPNDVLCGGRKVCGILAEHAGQGVNSRMVVGIGLNVNLDPSVIPSIPDSATSLRRELGRPVSRESVAIALFKRLDLWYGCLAHNPRDVFSAWASRLGTMGKTIIVVDASGTWTGRATGVQRDGGLRVRQEDGRVQTVYAADVLIRKAEDFTSS